MNSQITTKIYFRRRFFFKTIIVFLSVCTLTVSTTAQVKTGLRVLLEEKTDLIAGKRVGIIANHTSVDLDGTPIADAIARHAKVTALFGPEHGFQGNHSDGLTIDEAKYKSIPIYSLYGDYRMPSPKMLENIDVLVYDIQDVGVKFYTYISNLFLSMCAARRDGIPVIVLDRPNPIGADRVEGQVTNPANASFVGVIPLPARYGMTAGELAQLFNQETYAGFGIGCDLTVIPMQGYRRSMTYIETGVPWIGPSPNMPTVETALIYPGMCLIEGVNISEGRGIDSPFLTIGAPYIEPKSWLDSIPKEVMTGVKIEPITFTPRDLPGKAENPKYQDKKCQGLHFQVTGSNQLRPIELTVALLCSARDLYGKKFEVSRGIDRLWGDESLRGGLEAGWDYKKILQSTEDGVERFKKVRQKYLIYP